MRPLLHTETTSVPHYTTLDSNLYPAAIAIKEFGNEYGLDAWKAHYGQDTNSIAGAPVFSGGPTSVTIVDFALTPASPGYAEGAGANIARVGPQTISSHVPTTPSMPHGLRAR
jgi:hypothetical protein